MSARIKRLLATLTQALAWRIAERVRMGNTRSASDAPHGRGEIIEHVVLDTNHFYRDPDLQFAAWGDVIELVRAGHVIVYVPEIVLLEQIRHHDDANHRKLNAAIKDLARSLKDLTESGVKLPEINISDVRRQREAVKQSGTYGDELRSKLARAGVVILGHPTLNSRDLTDAYMRGRKPFKENGDGIADYIIWRSVVELRKSLHPSERVVLVTSNSKDFGTEGSDLHADLATDVAPLSVDVIETLADYIRGYDTSTVPSNRFETVRREPRELASERSLAFEAASAYAEGNLLYQTVSGAEEWGDFDIDGYAPPAPFQGITIDGIDLDGAASEWIPYDELDGTVVGRLIVPARIDIGAYVNKSDLAVYDDIRVANFDHNSHMSEVFDEVDVEVEFHVRVDGDAAEILNIESIRVVA